MQQDAGIDAHQVENLKREAKALRKSLNITHAEALDRLAVRNGYKNWSLLAKACSRVDQERTTETVQEPTAETLQRACQDFIKTLDDQKIEWLCKGAASFWVPARRVLDGTFAGIRILGIARDTMTARYAEEEGLLLLVDFAGLGDHLTFEGDEDYQEDEAGNPIQPAHGELFTPATGRSLLASLDFGDDIDSVKDRLEALIHPVIFDEYR
jgi:transcriptional regulator with XRE-family HTH domain